MKKKFFVSLALVIILSLITIPALASPPDPIVAGTWCYLPTNDPFANLQIHGKNTFIYIEDDGTWTGTFEGMSKDVGTTVIHGGSGKFNYHAYVTFEEVTVDENTGTLEMRVSGKVLDTGLWEGRWVITASGGGLSDLQGHGTWDGPGYDPYFPNDCGLIYYSGQIH